MAAPWSEIGRLETDIRNIKSQLGQMAQNHEVHQITSNIRSLENTISDLNHSFSNLQYEIETLREGLRQLREELIPEVS